MIKYFHELTKDEFDELVAKKMTWGECAKLYPQPTWCGYPGAVAGEMGCWSLMSFSIKGPPSCFGCELFHPANTSERLSHAWKRFRTWYLKDWIRNFGWTKR